MTPRALSLLAAYAVLLSTTGCPANWPFPPDTWTGTPCSYFRNLPRNVSVDVGFLDPRGVALLTADGASLLPAGETVSEVPVIEGVRSTSQFTSGKYALRAAREPGGAIVLLWSSDMPLARGGRQILVTTNGKIERLPETATALGLPAQLGRGELTVTLCIDLTSTRSGLAASSHPDLPGPRGASDDACVARVVLSAPWSKVAEVRELTAATPDYDYVVAPNVRTVRESCNLPPSLPASETVLYPTSSRVP